MRGQPPSVHPEAAGSQPAAPAGILRRAAGSGLAAIAVLGLGLVVFLPLIDLVLSRFFWSGLAESGPLVDHALVVLAFMAAALASLEGRHLSLTGQDQACVGLRAWLYAGAQSVAAAVQASLFWASLALTWTGFDPDMRVWIIPTRLLAASIPLGFLVMGLATAFARGASRARMASACVGLLVGSLLAVSSIRNLAVALLGGSLPGLEAASELVRAGVGTAILPLAGIVVLAAVLGAPLFTALGGLAVLLYVASGSYIELAPSEAYSLLRSGSIAALPLFGLAGFILAESGAGQRLVAVFRELFGWIRGGEAIAAVLACGFFSTFTGINGVTIIALGGLLVTVLSESGGFRRERARGLVTASGDIGLLLPPSAAVIVYGINAQFIYGEASAFDVATLFKGAVAPGLLLVLAMCAAGVVAAPRLTKGEARRPFSPGSTLAAIGPAFLELLVPLFAIVLYFTGSAGLTEIGAFCVLYIAVVEVLVKRELSPRGLLAILRRYLPIIGGTLVIIAAARGLSFYIIDANVPEAFSTWISARVASPFVFLLALNIFLLMVGCLMDIYSAILVVAPLVIPLGTAFGVDPVHFGVIFIMNLSIGFLTPSVGINIFLASYAFRKPVARIVRDVWPFLLVMLAVLLVITYVPWLSTFATHR
ncbi:MAG TPA: TRAP transporter large permease subunit [Rectinemataceae bacterium]|nr:TRAP transporter large permease subunit [Rectinemataceae bacterium]